MVKPSLSFALNPTLILSSVALLLLAYLVSYLPNFTAYNERINFFLFLGIWVVFQFIIVYAGYKIFYFMFNTFNKYKHLVNGLSQKVLSMVR